MVWGGLLPIPFYRIHTRLVYYTRLEQRKKKTLLVGSNANNSAYEQLERRFASYSGWLKYCNSKHLLHIIYLKTGLNYSNFVGKKDKISNYRGRSVYLVHVDLKHRYYNLQFIYKGCPIQVRSKSQKLINLVGGDNPPQIIIL